MRERAWVAASSVRVPQIRKRTHTRHAPLYKVFVHHDDVTPMDFVVDVVMAYFGLPHGRAVEVATEAHFQEVAYVISLTFEQAEFRVGQAHARARAAGYPLTFTYEPA